MTSSHTPAVPPVSPIRDRALGIIATATLLALLYFGRDVLVPITLAFILSLLIAPLVHALRRIGLGQTLSVLAAVIVLAVFFGAIAGALSCLDVEREPAIKMSTIRQALGSQPGRAVVWKTPTSARTKSSGFVSARRSPLTMARLTAVTKAAWMSEREPSMSQIGRAHV